MPAQANATRLRRSVQSRLSRETKEWPDYPVTAAPATRRVSVATAPVKFPSRPKPPFEPTPASVIPPVPMAGYDAPAEPPVWYRDRDMRAIVKRISLATGVSECEIKGRGRSGAVVTARQACAYWCARLTKKSLPQIGRYLGRDHTSVLYAMTVYPVWRWARDGRFLPRARSNEYRLPKAGDTTRRQAAMNSYLARLEQSR